MAISDSHKRNEAFDAETARDLAMVDALLDGEALVPAADEDLRQVVAELRAAAPHPRPQFVQRLDAAVTSGFAESPPTMASSGGRARRFGNRRRWLALAGACGVFLIAVSTTVMLTEGDEDVATTLSRNDRSTGTQIDGVPAGSGEAMSAPPLATEKAPGEAEQKSSARARKQVRTAELELVAKADELERRADEVIVVTDRYRGYVQESSVTGGDAGRANATFQLRLPADRFASALRDLSQIAHVRARTQDVTDVTAGYDRIGAALADARAQRSGLLKALANAESEQQVQSVKLRLRGVNRRIEGLIGRKQRLDERIDYVRLGVTIEAVAGDPDGSWSIGDALGDAWTILRAIFGGLIVAAAVLVPVVLVALAAFYARRRFVARSRARVVDSSSTHGL